MAIRTYTKGGSVKLSTNFKSSEFDCHGSGCCSTTKVDEQLVTYLQKIRDHFGKSVNVSSGYRCETHNKNVGGATGSRHAKGQAADIYINGVAPAEIAKYAESIGILGIGLYETDKDGHFVHVDTRPNKSFWYGQAQAKRTTFGGTAIKEETPETKPVDASNVNTAAADPKTVWDYFKLKGLNDFGIAGLMGNLYAESGLRPTNLQNTFEKKLGMSDAEYTAAVDSGAYDNFVKDSAGYGLAQWTYWSRKDAMLKFHKAAGKSIGDLQTQLDFLVKELTNNYSTSVWRVLKEATSVLEASNAVLLKFERPADQSVTAQNKRAEFGQKYYDQYATKVTQKPVEDTIEIPKESVGGKMKYSETNKPLVCMQTNSTCYKGTRTMDVKGVLWHSTGANNPNLKRYVQPSDDAPDRKEWLKLLGENKYQNDWNHISHQAGLNCWIGKLADGTVTTVQTMPWDFRPWGCGSGSKGSCNNGWIQFEICEDGLSDKNYFDKVYKEACEITAYLCKLYNLDPNGTVEYNGVKVPVILCHDDSHSLGFGSNHGDVNHWFPKFGKSMKTVRADVAALIGKGVTETPVQPPKEPVKETVYYRVRKSWKDAASQKGAYTSLDNAKKCVDELGTGWFVFDEKGNVVYPETIKATYKKGDTVKLVAGATYSNGAAIKPWVFNAKLYVRDIRSNGDIVISTLKEGDVTGVVSPNFLEPYGQVTLAPKEIERGDIVRLTKDAVYSNGGKIASWAFDKKLYVREGPRSNGDFVVSTVPTGPITGVVNKKYLVRIAEAGLYTIQVTASILNVREKPNTSSKIAAQVKNGSTHAIYEVNNGWGRTDMGWIYLMYTKKV